MIESMKDTRLIMGMPIEIEIVGEDVNPVLEDAFKYLVEVDTQFSPYKEESEVSRINRGEVKESELSEEMREVFTIGERMKRDTGGHFDIRRPDGLIDPSGVVKGWAIQKTAEIIRSAG